MGNDTRGEPRHDPDRAGGVPGAHGLREMIGGIVAATFLTLLFLPALYVGWYRLEPPPRAKKVKAPAAKVAPEPVGALVGAGRRSPLTWQAPPNCTIYPARDSIVW